MPKPMPKPMHIPEPKPLEMLTARVAALESAVILLSSTVARLNVRVRDSRPEESDR